MSDLLRMDFINSLGQLLCRKYGDRDCWRPLESICVQTGMLRLDVCGLLDVSHIGDIAEFKDLNGKTYDSEEFYYDYIENDKKAGEKKVSSK